MNIMAREFCLKNPTPLGAAHATNLGSRRNKGNPTAPTRGEKEEATKEVRRGHEEERDPNSAR